jgi:hypothetical protein
MELLGIFNRDACGGLLKLRNQQRLVRYAKLAGGLRGVFIDIGFEAVRNNSSVNIFDYIHYIDMVGRALRTRVYYVVPDSHDLAVHLNNVTVWYDLARTGKAKVAGDPVVVIHYYWNVTSEKIIGGERGEFDAKAWYRLMLMRYLDRFGNVVIGIPVRVLTLSWNNGEPIKIQCKTHPDKCIKYIEKAIIELSNYGFTHFHLLGINRKEWRWLTSQVRGGSLGSLNVIISADTDNYRLAVKNELRRRDYGKGLYMVQSDGDACVWFNEWVRV